MNVKEKHSETFHRYELNVGLAHHERLIEFLRMAVQRYIGTVATHEKEVADGRRSDSDLIVHTNHLNVAIRDLSSQVFNNLRRSNPLITRDEYETRVDETLTLLLKI